MSRFPFIMVDIETTGTQPETTNIIQIAAVRFNLETGEVDHDTFDRCLRPLPTRFWDEDTRRFWSKMPTLLDTIWGRMEDPKKVLADLKVFAMKDQRESPILWAKPISFEGPFLASYFRELDIQTPFKYWETMDLNSFIKGRFFPDMAPKIEKELEFVGSEHHALYDTFHQVKVAIEAYRRTGGYQDGQAQ